MAEKKTLFEIARSHMGEQDESRVLYWLSTGSLLVDLVINRGLPGGKLIELFGEEAAGKTALALATCRQAQLQGGTAIWVDVENRLSHSLAVRYNNISTDKGWLYYNCDKKEQPITVESALDFLMEVGEAAAQAETPTVFVLDSIPALHSKDQDTSMEQKRQNMLVANKLSAWFSYGFLSLVTGSNFYPIFINQVRAAPNFFSYGPPKDTTPAGKAIKFYASLRLKLSSSSLAKKEKDGKEIGRMMKVYVEKSSVGPPYRSAQFPFYFSEQAGGIIGMDDTFAQINYLISRGAIEQPTKGWYTLNGVKKRKLEWRKEAIESEATAKMIRDLVLSTFEEEYK